MDRIVRGRSATLSKTFTFTPTGTPSVVLTRVSDGTTVTTGAVSGSGTTWTYTIPATSNTLLDTYEEAWTAVTGGEPQTFDDNTIEVAGGSFFTLAEFRAFVSGTFTDDVIREMRTTVEQEIEQVTGCSFVPRYTLQTLDGSGSSSILLRPLISRVRSATVDGTVFTAGDLTALSIGLTGTVYSASRSWLSGSSNVVVGYEHGYQDTPHGIKRAALILAKSWLVGQRSPIDDRAITFSTNDLGSYSLAVPGRGGSHFGIPEVDATLDRYSLSVGLA